MSKKRYRDILAGTILALIGASAAIYSLANNTLGTVARMGPGFLPSVLGAILFILGLVIVLFSALRPTSDDGAAAVHMDVKSFIAIMLALIAFGMLIESFGAVPAILATVAISRLAEDRITIVGSLVLGAFMSSVVVVIFNVGLGMSFPIIRWPF